MTKHRKDKRGGKPVRQQRRAGKPQDPRSKMLWLYGLHPVTAALRNPARQAVKLIATRQAAERLHATLPDLTVPLEISDSTSVAALLPEDAVHQGLALACTPLNQPFLEDLAEGPDAPPALVVLDQVTDPHNVGAILRTSAVFGAGAVVIQDRHAPPESGVLAKSASGALESVPLIRIGNLARSLEVLKQAGYWVVGLDGEAEAGLQGLGEKGKTALVLGAEGQGLRRLTAETCDFLVKIPMAPNAVGSLNVSNAAAVALYELTRAAHKVGAPA